MINFYHSLREYVSIPRSASAYLSKSLLLFFLVLTFTASTTTYAQEPEIVHELSLWEKLLDSFGWGDDGNTVVQHDEANADLSNEFYEKALVSLSEEDTDAAIIHLNNAIGHDKGNLSAYTLVSQIYLERFDGAAAEYVLRSAIANGIDSKFIAKYLAQAYLQQSKFKDVLESVSVNGLPKQLRGEVNILKAEALIRMGDLEEARSIADTILQSEPDNIHASLLFAKINLDSDLGEAKKRLDSLAKKGHSTADYWFYLSEYYRRAGEVSKALETLTKAIDMAPRNLVYKHSRASLLLDQNKLDEALVDIEQVRKLHSGDLRGMMLESLYHQKAGDLEAKTETLKEAYRAIDQLNFVKLQDDAYNLMLVSNIYYLGQRFTDAETLLKRYLEMRPNDLKAYHLLASTQLHNNKPLMAKLTIEKGLKVNVDGTLMMLLAETEVRLKNFASATKIYEDISRLNPSMSNIQQRLALAKLAEGRHQEAIKLLKGLIKESPFNTANKILLSKVYLGITDYEKAIATAKSIIDTTPELVIPYNIIGNAYLGNGDLKEARRYFLMSLEKSPEFIPSLFNLATIDVKEGMHEEAVNKLQKILELDPKNAMAMNQMAGIYMQRGDRENELEWRKKSHSVEVNVESGLRLVELYYHGALKYKAETTLKEILQDFPENLKLLAMDAHFSLENNNLDKAKNTYRKMSRIAIDNQSIKDILSVFSLQKKAGDIPEAEKTLDKAMEIFKDNIALIAAKADIDISRNDYRAALKKARSIINMSEESALGYKLAGDAHVLLSQFDEALTYFKKGIESAPRDEALALSYYKTLDQHRSGSEAVKFLEGWLANYKAFSLPVLQALAAGYAKTGRLKEAVDINEKLLQVQANNPYIINNLAILYLDLGDERALSFAQRAHELAPDSYPILDTLGWVLTKTGSPAEGLPYLRSASARSFNSPDIQYHYAVALSMTGENRKSAQVLKQLLSLGQDFNELDDAKKLYSEIR